MGVFEAILRLSQLGGEPQASARVAALRARFEERTGAFLPEDPWFEERSRAFWCDALTRGRFGRSVEDRLTAPERAFLGPLERAHRGLFRLANGPEGSGGPSAAGPLLVDVWSGAEFVVTHADDEARAELEAGAEQLFDARLVGLRTGVGAGNTKREPPLRIALLPGAVFHPRSAAGPLEGVLSVARARSLSTHETLDALLRMERTLRSLSRVKPAFAYRPESLWAPVAGPLGRVGATGARSGSFFGAPPPKDSPQSS
jgi:hypothetical protein